MSSSVDNTAETAAPVTNFNKSTPILMVCDLQERFAPAISNFDHVVKTTLKVLKAGEVFGFRAVISEQKPSVFGPTVSPILEGLSNIQQLGTFPKTRFGMTTPEILEVLEAHAERGAHGTELVLMGIETHICVQQTALQLAPLGWKIIVLADAVASVHPEEVKIALDLMRSSGVTVTTSESWLYTKMGDAARPEFRAFAKVIKKSKSATEESLRALLGPPLV